LPFAQLGTGSDSAELVDVSSLNRTDTHDNKSLLSSDANSDYHNWCDECIA